MLLNIQAAKLQRALNLAKDFVEKQPRATENSLDHHVYFDLYPLENKLELVAGDKSMNLHNTIYLNQEDSEGVVEAFQEKISFTISHAQLSDAITGVAGGVLVQIDLSNTQIEEARYTNVEITYRNTKVVVPASNGQGYVLLKSAIEPTLNVNRFVFNEKVLHDMFNTTGNTIAERNSNPLSKCLNFHISETNAECLTFENRRYNRIRYDFKPEEIECHQQNAINFGPSGFLMIGLQKREVLDLLKSRIVDKNEKGKVNLTVYCDDQFVSRMVVIEKDLSSIVINLVPAKGRKFESLMRDVVTEPFAFVEAKDIREVITHASKFSEIITIKAENNTLEVSCNSDDSPNTSFKSVLECKTSAQPYTYTISARMTLDYIGIIKDLKGDDNFNVIFNLYILSNGKINYSTIRLETDADISYSRLYYLNIFGKA